MIGTLLLILICLIVLAVLWHILKNVVQIVINSVMGLLLLGIVKFLNIFPILGFSEIQIGWISVLVCAIAGIPGAILLMILHVFGLA